MDIKIPRVRIIRPQHIEDVTENIIKRYLTLCFWLSWSIPLGVWKIYDLISPLIISIKG